MWWTISLCGCHLPDFLNNQPPLSEPPPLTHKSQLALAFSMCASLFVAAAAMFESPIAAIAAATAGQQPVRLQRAAMETQQKMAFLSDGL